MKKITFKAVIYFTIGVLVNTYILDRPEFDINAFFVTLSTLFVLGVIEYTVWNVAADEMIISYLAETVGLHKTKYRILSEKIYACSRFTRAELDKPREDYYPQRKFLFGWAYMSDYFGSYIEPRKSFYSAEEADRQLAKKVPKSTVLIVSKN